MSSRRDVTVARIPAPVDGAVPTYDADAGEAKWAVPPEAEEAGVPSPFIFGVPAVPVADGDLAANQIAFWSNDGSNLLAFKMKNSAGVVKTGTVALT